MRLTLRTLLAYLDDTLEPAQAREIGLKVAENPSAQELIDRIKKVTRRRGLATPPSGKEGSASDPNTVAEYLSDALSAEQIAQLEQTCLDSDIHLAEVAACHQILTLVVSEQVRVPPTARQRMYQLVKGRESIPHRKPGATIPIGGMRDDEKPTDSDDAETALLLGLPAYSATESSSRRAIWAAAVGGLVAMLAFAVWMAFPKAERSLPSDPPALAAGPSTVRPTALGEPTAPKVPLKVDGPKVEPIPAKMPKPPEEPMKVVPPPPPIEPPVKELVPTVPLPRADRLPIGTFEKSTAILVRKPPGAERWLRVTNDEPGLFSADRVIALPGYKATLQLDGLVTVTLWGNLPELSSSLVLESSVTPSAPSGEFDADITLHQGRIYLGTKMPAGAKIRVRFLKEIWDVTLADAKAEVVFEVVHTLVPGKFAERPQSSVGFAVLDGKVSLKMPNRSAPVDLEKGGIVYWDSKGGKPDVRLKPMPGERSTYYSKLTAPPNGSQAEATLAALNGFSQKLADPQRVRATFDEALLLKESAPTYPEFAAWRVAVLAFAAMNDLTGLADSLSDPLRHSVRISAIVGLRSALAYDDDSVERFAKLLIDKQRMSPDEAQFVLRLLRGFSASERAEPESLDILRDGLSSSSLVVRELAFQNLLTFLKPGDRVPDVLLLFDAAASEGREPVVRQWNSQIEKMKQNLLKPSTVELAPAPRVKK